MYIYNIRSLFVNESGHKVPIHYILAAATPLYLLCNLLYKHDNNQ